MTNPWLKSAPMDLALTTTAMDIAPTMIGTHKPPAKPMDTAPTTTAMDTAPTMIGTHKPPAKPMDIAPTTTAPMEAAPMEAAPMEAAPTSTAPTTPQRAVGSQPAPKAHALTKMHTTIKQRRTPNATTSGRLGIIGADALGWALLAMQSRQTWQRYSMVVMEAAPSATAPTHKPPAKPMDIAPTTTAMDTAPTMIGMHKPPAKPMDIAPTTTAPMEAAPTTTAPTATAPTTPQRAVGSHPAPKTHALTKKHTTIKQRRTPNATTPGGLGIIGADALGGALLALQSRQTWKRYSMVVMEAAPTATAPTHKPSAKAPA